MPTAANRRAFLRQAACWSAAATAPGLARAIEPLTRNGQSKFKFSLAAYSYRDLLSGQPPAMTLEEFIADCAAMQLEGTELTSYYFPETSPEYLRRLKQAAFRLGLDVSGTAVGNDFCHPPGPQRDGQLALVKSWVHHAEILGAPVIRIFSGSVQEGQSESEAKSLAIQGMEECC